MTSIFTSDLLAYAQAGGDYSQACVEVAETEEHIDTWLQHQKKHGAAFVTEMGPTIGQTVAHYQKQLIDNEEEAAQKKLLFDMCASALTQEQMEYFASQKPGGVARFDMRRMAIWWDCIRQEIDCEMEDEEAEEDEDPSLPTILAE